MALAPDLLYLGGECLSRLGTLTQRSAPWEDEAETFTRTGQAQYVERNGVLKLADANLARVEWVSPDSAGLRSTPALLLEDASTNGFTRAEALDNAVWVKARCSITADDETAPDGAATMDKIVEDGTASSTHNVKRNTPTLTNDTNQAFSFFAKADERTELRAELVGKDGATNSAFFDLAAGVVGTTVNCTARIEALANGIYRCFVETVDCGNGGTTPVIGIFLSSGSETLTYNGDSASGLHVWGIDYEVDKSFCSSYVQTVASTVTRNVEVFYADFPWAPQEMTVYAKFIELGTVQISSARVLQISNAANADARLFLIESGGFYRFQHDNGPTAVSSTQAVAPSLGDTVELRGLLASTGRCTIGQSINSAAEVVAAQSGAAALAAAWSGERCYINSVGTTGKGFAAFEAVKINRGTKTMAEMRAL